MSHVDDGLLHAYLDGELSAREVAHVEAHLAECAPCRARLDEERALVQRAAQLLDLAAPPEGRAPPLADLGVRRPWGRLPLPLAWAATVVLALGIGWYVGGQGEGAPRDVDAGMGLAVTEASPTAGARADELRQVQPQPATPPPPAAPPETRRLPESRVEPVARDVAAGPPAPPAPPAPSERRDTGVAAEREADAPPAAVVVTAAPGAAAEVGMLDVAAARQAEGAWTPIGVDSARALLGTDPVALPDLPVFQVRRRAGGVRQVLVEQQLSSGVLVGFTQTPATEVRAAWLADSVAAVTLSRRRAENAPAGAAAPGALRAPVAPLARYVGSLRVEISGPVSPDSLNRLLERARPIP